MTAISTDFDLASYSMTPGRRTSYPASNLHIDIDPAYSPTANTFAPQDEADYASRSAVATPYAPPISRQGSDGSIGEASIQFKRADIVRRSDPQVRTLYNGMLTSPAPTPKVVNFTAAKMPMTYHSPASEMPGPRKASLVRPEEYMAPLPKAGTAFNPYFSPSWSRKPSDGLDLDLEGEMYDEADEISLRQSRFESIALPSSSVPSLGHYPSTIAESDTASIVDSRTLGGKKLINSGDWRKKLRLETKATTNAAAMKGNSPVFNVSFREKGQFVPLDEKHGAASVATQIQIRQQQGHEPNIVELTEGMRQARPRLLLLSPLTALLVQGLVIGYLYLRGRYLVEASSHYTIPFIGGWLFFAVEVIYAYRTGSAMLWQVFGRNFEEYRTLRIKGDAYLPTVDVLVICTGQHDQLVMDSAIAAAKLDWPVDKLRVLIIDDSASHELQRRAESYANSRALHLTYHRRAVRNGAFKTGSTAKSALINFGLTETRLHGRTAGDFTLVLDADCIPDPDMLRAMVPYMLQDQQLGLVRSSQVFYNVPSPMSSTLGTFINAVEPIEAARSGFLMRRCAVEDVGGFPTASSVEDGQLAALLAGKGYRTRMVRETLQHGLVPDSWVAHLRQGIARNIVGMRTARRLGFYLFGGLRLKHMTFTRRVANLCSALAPMFSLDVFAAAVVLPASLLLGDVLVPVLKVAQLNALLRIMFAAMVADRLHDLVFSLRTGEAGVSRILTRYNFMAPYTVLALVKSVFAGVPSTESAFEREDDVRERAVDPSRRVSMFRRLANVMFGAMGTLVHLALAIAVVVGLTWSLVRVLVPLTAGSRSGYQAGLLSLLTFAWPTATLLWVNLLKAAAVPFAYAFSPPTVPSRDRLLVRDPITSIARPVPDCRRQRPFLETKTWSFAGALLSTVYITVLFALSFDNRLAL